MPEEILSAILAQAEKEEAAHLEQLQQAQEAHARSREELILEHIIDAAGGRNQKAILALLDREQLQGAADFPAEAKQAVEQLKKDCSYLFQTPIPPFSRQAGSGNRELPQQATLAGAIKARMQRRKDD